MWKMFDDMIECDECGGFLGPPPKFTIPPPPRPPFLGDYSLTKCNEEEMAIKAQQAWDRDICEGMPLLDASLYSSQSLQTSAIIAVFTLLLVLVVLISSLFVWKNKRKVQNFLPCKTPTRGPHHVNGGLPLGGNHSLTYEDPDVHLGHHRPLVMRHHHNVEMLHGKSIHYPSGYPMTRSPPFLVSSSPGPDPYRSNDNVYEELGPGRDSDGESEPPLHSDDDFAEDELSLPGERFFNKSNEPINPASATLATTAPSIYHERAPIEIQANGPGVSCAVNGHERNSVLSVSSTSTQEASTATAASMCSSSHNNAMAHQNPRNMGCSGSSSATPRCTSSGIFSGMLRHTTGRNKFHTTAGARARAKNTERRNGPNTDDFNTSSSTADANEIGPLQQIYDNQSNLMSLAYIPQQQQQQQQQLPHQSQRQPMHQQTPIGAGSRVAYHHSLHQFHNSNNNNNNNNNNSARPPTIQFYNTLESEVDRRNRINAQLNNAPAVATIFRERINYPGSGRYQHPQPYYASNCSNGLMANSIRARTASRSMDRRRRVTATANTVEPSYGYAEPVYHENFHYEAYPTPAAIAERLGQNPMGAYSHAYATPDYAASGGSFRQHLPHGSAQQQPAQLTCPNATHLYNRGDSSFGSDSGYSHHTPASSIGRHDYDFVVPVASSAAAAAAAANNTPKESTTSKISAALSFSWNRRKGAPTLAATTNTAKAQPASAAAALGLMSTSHTEATSPNNNSTSSTTVTSTLENTSSASSTSTSACSTTSNQNNNTAAPTLHQAQAQAQVQA